MGAVNLTHPRTHVSCLAVSLEDQVAVTAGGRPKSLLTGWQLSRPGSSGHHKKKPPGLVRRPGGKFSWNSSHSDSLIGICILLSLGAGKFKKFFGELTGGRSGLIFLTKEAGFSCLFIKQKQDIAFYKPDDDPTGVD